MTLIYCYDAYCGWCYGFSQVMKKVNSEYKNILAIEVLSGGMIFRIPVVRVFTDLRLQNF